MRIKNLAVLLIAFVLIFAVTACGTSGDENNKGTNEGTNEGTEDTGDTGVGSDEDVTLKVANYALLESGYTEFWEGVKEDFEAEYDNVTIEWVTAPYGEMINQVMNMAGAGDKVDVIFSELIWIPALVESGLAEPIENVLDEDFLADYYPNILEAHSMDGVAYAAPLYVSPSVLFYNTEIFEQAGLDPTQPPTTYDEMFEMAEKIDGLTTADGNKIYAFGQPTASVPVVGASLTAFVSNFGGYTFNEAGDFDVDNEGFFEGMEALQTLDERGYNPQNTKPKDLRNLFALGQLAMYYDNSWGYNGISSINPEAENFTATAFPLQGGNGDGSSTLQSHNFVAINNGDTQLEATKNFIQFVIDTERLEDYMLNITPAFAAKAEMESVVHPVLEGSNGAIEKAVATKMVGPINDFYLELTALSQAITVGNEDIQEAIDNFKPSAEAILAR